MGTYWVLLEQHFHFLQVPSAGSLPPHTTRTLCVRWAGFGWIPLPVTPGCCTPLPSKPGEFGLTILLSQGQERNQNFLLLFRFINLHILPQRNKHKGKEFCRKFLPPLIVASLPVRVQHHSVSIFPEITHEHKVRPRQVKVPSKISQH